MDQQPQPVSSPAQLESLGQRLRGQRLHLGISQETLAEELGVSVRSIRRWELDQAIPQAIIRQRLYHFLGIGPQPPLGVVSGEETPVEDIPDDKIAIEQPEALAPTKAPAPLSSRWKNAFPFLSNKKRWAFLFSGLLLACLLLSTIIVWRSRGSTSDNPYIGKGTLTLNNPLAENSAASWSLSNNDEGQCFFADGTYRIRGIKNEYMKLCLATETYFNDFTYEVKMQVIAGDCGGMAFRTNFPQLYYFLACQDGRYRFVRYDRDHQANIRIISSGTSMAINRGLRSTNVIAVTAIGNTFTLYINHTPVYSGTDGAYLDGQIGLLVHTCSIIYLGPPPDVCAAPVEVAFSDARAWKL